MVSWCVTCAALSFVSSQPHPAQPGGETKRRELEERPTRRSRRATGCDSPPAPGFRAKNNKKNNKKEKEKHTLPRNGDNPRRRWTTHPSGVGETIGKNSRSLAGRPARRQQNFHVVLRACLFLSLSLFERVCLPAGLHGNSSSMV